MPVLHFGTTGLSWVYPISPALLYSLEGYSISKYEPKVLHNDTLVDTTNSSADGGSRCSCMHYYGYEIRQSLQMQRERRFLFLLSIDPMVWAVHRLPHPETKARARSESSTLHDANAPDANALLR